MLVTRDDARFYAVIITNDDGDLDATQIKAALQWWGKTNLNAEITVMDVTEATQAMGAAMETVSNPDADAFVHIYPKGDNDGPEPGHNQD